MSSIASPATSSGKQLYPQFFPDESEIGCASASTINGFGLNKPSPSLTETTALPCVCQTEGLQLRGR